MIHPFGQNSDYMNYMGHFCCIEESWTLLVRLYKKILSEKNRLSSTIWKMSGMMKLYGSYHSLWYEILAIYVDMM